MHGKLGRVTLQDVADHAGVGVATVDRVLNNRAPVRAKTAALVLAAAEELDFYGKGLIRRRIAEMAPRKRLGFILQKEGKWFYRTLAGELHRAADDLNRIRASVEIRYVESLSPEALGEEIALMGQRVDAIGVVSVDHPAVTAAVVSAQEIGLPVFAMLSPLSVPGLAGFVGVDGRRAGRTAGWAMARMVGPDAEIGILVGSHRYLGHEAREVGFRSYMREFAPETRLRDSIVYLDDPDVAYEAASELLHKCPDMTGLYHCGGGVAGVVRALREAGRSDQTTYICYERSPTAIAALAEGIVDLVVATPLEQVARNVTRAMQAALLPQLGEATLLPPLDFQVITSENA